MKKTLVALAVLATAGTAFAENSINLTGNFGFGAQRGLDGRTHLAITDGSLTFAGTEELGSGLVAGFNLSQDFFRWSNAGAAPVATTDVYGTLTGGFGQIKGGQWESLSAAWTGGNVAPISLPEDLYKDGAILQAGTRDLRLAYIVPIGPLKASFVVTDRTEDGFTPGNPGESFGPGNPQNEFAGTIGLGYTYGGLSAQFAAKNVNVKDRNALQLGAKYDFSGFMIGAGVDYQELGANEDRTGFLVSVAAPLGPVKIGATYGQSDLDIPGLKDPKALMIGAQYDISKRTGFNLSFGQFDSASGTAWDNTQKIARFKVQHNF